MEEIKEVKFAPGLTADIMFAELHNQGRDYLRLMSYYSSAMLEVETKFKVLNIEFSNKFDRNPIESIQTRLKKPMSIYEKLNRLHIPVSVEGIEKNLNDIAGVRVICSFVDDIYKLADMLEMCIRDRCKPVIVVTEEDIALDDEDEEAAGEQSEEGEASDEQQI